MEGSLVESFLDDGEIILPKIILKEKTILEFEECLKTGRAFYVSRFFKKVKDNFDEYFDTVGLEKLQELITISNENNNVSESDEKIINLLLSNQEVKPSLILELLGQSYFTLQVISELEKSEDLSKILKMIIVMWCFVNIYELVLSKVDKYLYLYLVRHKGHKTASIEKFMNLRKNNKDHATAGLINKIFCEILSIDEDNDSIFGKSSRLLRNKISHANIFYDSEKDKIILLDGGEFTTEDFVKEYQRILNFLVTWINKAAGDKNKVEFVSYMKEYLQKLSSTYLKIERSGDLRKKFEAYIIKLKQKSEHKQTENQPT